MVGFFNPIEVANPMSVRGVQNERLSWTVDHAYENSPMYRRIFTQAGILPREIAGVEDLPHLPFTTKEDLRRAFPRGALAVAIEEVRYLGLTSGTTGKPIVVYLSQEDARNMASSVARAYHALGMGPTDIAQVMVSTKMAWMWENAFRFLGMSVVNSGVGNALAQAASVRDLGITVLVSTPSYILRLADAARELGHEPSSSTVTTLIPVAEPFGEGTRKRLESTWGADAYDGYGCMEMANGFVECPAKNGHHVFADHFICEVIDPKTEKWAEKGQRGELVFTTLTRKATPLIRYRTRDIVHMEEGTCTCGRTHPKLFFHGRMDEMTKIKGQSVFPTDLERSVMSMDGVMNYQAVVRRRENKDLLTLKVESNRPDRDLAATISESVKGACNVTPQVQFVKPGSLSASGKTKRFVDRRSI